MKTLIGLILLLTTSAGPTPDMSKWKCTWANHPEDGTLTLSCKDYGVCPPGYELSWYISSYSFTENPPQKCQPKLPQKGRL